MSKSIKKAGRRAARALILQILYEIDVSSHHPADTLAYHLDEADLSHAQEGFVREMVLGTLKYEQELNQYIRDAASEWPLDQMAPVDRNILRLALYELHYQPNRPHQIVINEAVQLAQVYGSDSSQRFVNGVLGALMKRNLQASAGVVS